MSYDPNKPKRLDDLEQRLYSPRQDIVIKERKPLHEKEYNVPQDWANNKVEEPIIFQQDIKKPNWFLRFFVVAFLFFVGAAGYAGYIFLYGSQSINRNVDILINAPLAVSAGEPFEFEVILENKDASPIILGELVVEYPDGTRKTGDISTLSESDFREIARVEGGTTVKENYSVLLFGEENEKRDIRVFLTYRTEDTTSFFEKEKVFDTVLSSTPVRMTVNHISETTSGQDIAFTIELVSNSTQELKDIIVEASFPFGFNLKSSSIPVQDDKKTWIISSLNPKESLTFTVAGSLNGLQGEDKFFKFVTGLKTSNKDTPLVVFNTRSSTVSIQRAFLELALNINGDADEVIDITPGINQRAQLSFKNNAESPIRNAQIVMTLSGNALKKESINLDKGFYQSNDNTIVWDSTTVPELANFPVGGFKTLNFGFNTLGVSDNFFETNPEIQFSINVRGNRNTDGDVIDTLQDTIVRTIKLNSEVDVSANSEYFSTVFSNTGSMPPKVGTKTSYTGVLEIANSSNQLQNAIIKMNVPNYVQYNNVFSPSTENVSYDPITRIITWNIGSIPIQAGYAGKPLKRLYVQTSITPSISQMSTNPELLKAITFEAQDTFTQKEIKQKIPSITTEIRDKKSQFDSNSVIR